MAAGSPQPALARCCCVAENTQLPALRVRRRSLRPHLLLAARLQVEALAALQRGDTEEADACERRLRASIIDHEAAAAQQQQQQQQPDGPPY